MIVTPITKDNKEHVYVAHVEIIQKKEVCFQVKNHILRKITSCIINTFVRQKKKTHCRKEISTVEESLPLQNFPFPSYPSLQLHLKDPMVFTHVACSEQNTNSPSHSLISIKKYK